MLVLKNIRKDYKTSGETVRALRGIDLSFRKSEFVAVLGPSGCGKTTLLNIIGGLDGYTSGRLSVNGKPTDSFTDRDWDAYRNHSIGFVFQNYNLIPHQSVLRNVELSLTLSGVGKRESRARAAAALEKVGLGDQLKKRPNQMSGGQMQRVAIARAIVNDPEIVLADEPTGALDTETGLQVMELLKEISRDRLVIMVTHNPDLAEKYATRIINMLDGKVTADTDPYDGEEPDDVSTDADVLTEGAGKPRKKPSMSLLTSFGLSLNNLISKKGRTILTSFAGSIGIIGIALIYAMSQGASDFINSIQQQTLASYPLVIQAESVDLSSLIENFMGKTGDSAHERDAVYSKSMIYDLVNTLNTSEKKTNDLTAFKKYLDARLADENDESGLREAVTGLLYSYDLNPTVYTMSVDGTVLHSDLTELMSSIMSGYLGTSDSSGGGNLLSLMTTSSTSSSNSYGLWQELLPGLDGGYVSDIVTDDYDLLYGSWPESMNEAVLIVDRRNELNDLSLYAMGLIPRAEIDAALKSMAEQSEINYTRRSWSYEEICSNEFRLIIPSSAYVYDAETGLYTDLRKDEAGMQILYAGGIPLRISGIVREAEDAVGGMLKSGIGYTHALTEYIASATAGSDIVKKQTESPDVDVFTGLQFKEAAEKMSDAEKAARLKETLASMPDKDKAQSYIAIMSIPSDEAVKSYVESATASLDRAGIEEILLSRVAEQSGINPSLVKNYISSISDEDLIKTVETMLAEAFRTQYAASVSASLSKLPDKDLAASLDAAIGGYSDRMCAEYYDGITEFSSSTLKKNLSSLGGIDLESPSTLSIYTDTFARKDAIKSAIDAYNESVDELYRIEYTDYVGIMMSSITTILDSITYVLIAFVAISLFVSSIMIGVITLISVQERIREIGILRAIGASKLNVASLFNAETVMIGLASGVIGVTVSALVCLPVNLVLHLLTGFDNLSARLPLTTALILIAISAGLTLLAGLIPAYGASRKDPVVALRTE